MADAGRRQAAHKARPSATSPAAPAAAEARRSAVAGAGNRALQRLAADPETSRAAAPAARAAGNSAVQRLVSPGGQAPVQRQPGFTPEEQKKHDEKRRNEEIIRQEMAGPRPDPRLNAEARTGRIADAAAQQRANAAANVDSYEAQEKQRKQREAWLKSIGA